jgi:hypothetical protein
MTVLLKNRAHFIRPMQVRLARCTCIRIIMTVLLKNRAQIIVT